MTTPKHPGAKPPAARQHGKKSRVASAGKQRRVAAAVEALVKALDVESEQTRKTPERVAKMWLDHLIDGEHTRIDEVIPKLSKTPSDDLIIMRDIAVHSVCPHHLLPYEVNAHLAFVPNGVTCGFSRIAQWVEVCAHRMILLEDLAQTVTDGFYQRLGARGVAVFLDSRHGCMLYQGTPRPETRVQAWAFRGVFETSAAKRKEVISLLR